MLDLLIYNPLTNLLLLIYDVLFNNYFLAVIVLTLLIKLVTLPLTLKQQASSMRMAALQPQVKELQEKHKGDPRKLQEEMKAIGFSPLAGCLPTLVQFPILIGLYTAIQRTLAFSPLSLLELGKHMYSFLPNLAPLVPINSTIFGGLLDMGALPVLTSVSIIIPILVFVTTWLSSKMMQTPTADPQQAQTMQMMNVMMPMMITFFSLQTPIGLGIYWIVSNVLGVGQYYLMKPRMDALKAQYGNGTPASNATAATKAAEKPLFAPPKSKVKAKPATGNKSASAKPATTNKSASAKS
ncbi:MAG: YidC/Oxa1 family membrane protein insertase [Anaerolineae bacterium]|nr:YidC/Oxa1 family membrane protein insertase [Anaerolineae bacterium]